MITITHTPSGLALTRDRATIHVAPRAPAALAAAIRDLTARPAPATAAELGARIAHARYIALATEVR
jgi:hypothetical protein